jgi:hypothetical protein
MGPRQLHSGPVGPMSFFSWRKAAPTRNAGKALGETIRMASAGRRQGEPCHSSELAVDSTIPAGAAR